MNRLLRSCLKPIRGPKKKAAAEVEASTEYINIFKDRKDPVKV